MSIYFTTEIYALFHITKRSLIVILKGKGLWFLDRGDSLFFPKYKSGLQEFWYMPQILKEVVILWTKVENSQGWPCGFSFVRCFLLWSMQKNTIVDFSDCRTINRLGELN